MTEEPKIRMTVDQYLSWAEENPGRYELYDGIIYAMSPETLGHAELKWGVQSALRKSIRANRLACRMLPDGMTIRINEHISFEPDALVYCGDRLPRGTIVVPNPTIIVEVLSPSTRRIDISRKLVAYFQVPSVHHYLILETEEPAAILHSRGDGETIRTQIIRKGAIVLDPPGIELSMAEIYDSEQD
jgi:Uma2 family endonuclease